jgi:hypothetical protein
MSSSASRGCENQVAADLYDHRDAFGIAGLGLAVPASELFDLNRPAA